LRRDRGNQLDPVGLQARENDLDLVLVSPCWPRRVERPNTRQYLITLPGASKEIACIQGASIHGVSGDVPETGGWGSLAALFKGDWPRFPGQKARERQVHLVIDVTAAADSNDQNGEHAVADFSQQPVVTHPITPEIAQLRASQRPSELAGIIKRREALAQILPDPPGIGRTKTLDLSCGSCCNLNLPEQARHPARQGTGTARPTCDAQSLPVQQHRDPPLTGGVLRPLRGCRTSRSGLSWRKAPSGGRRFRPEGGRLFVCSFLPLHQDAFIPFSRDRCFFSRGKTRTSLFPAVSPEAPGSALSESGDRGRCVQ